MSPCVCSWSSLALKQQLSTRLLIHYTHVLTQQQVMIQWLASQLAHQSVRWRRCHVLSSCSEQLCVLSHTESVVWPLKKLRSWPETLTLWLTVFQNRAQCMKSNWWPTMETGRVTAPRDWCHWRRKVWVIKALVSPGCAVRAPESRES